MNKAEYKQRLQAEERRLSKNIEGADARARGVGDKPDSDWGDASVNDEEKDEQFHEADSDVRTLHQVQDALRRIEAGTFGKCLVDGGPIEEQRLRAIPWTPYCLKHERLREKEAPSRMPSL